jgi:hypothetical protein
LSAAHPGRLAVGHAGDGRGDGWGDAARAAAGAAEESGGAGERGSRREQGAFS